MGEYVSHTDFYGITVDLDKIFTDMIALEEEDIDWQACIEYDDWEEFNLEIPEIINLCKSLNLDVTPLCSSNKYGSLEKDIIGIGFKIQGSTNKERIESLIQAEKTVTKDKIEKIIDFLGLKYNNLKLETYYSAG